MNWIKIEKDNPILPSNPGKYLVKTSTMMGNSHKVETRFDGKAFIISRQIVTHWLNEN